MFPVISIALNIESEQQTDLCPMDYKTWMFTQMGNTTMCVAAAVVQANLSGAYTKSRRFQLFCILGRCVCSHAFPIVAILYAELWQWHGGIACGSYSHHPLTPHIALNVNNSNNFQMFTGLFNSFMSISKQVGRPTTPIQSDMISNWCLEGGGEHNCNAKHWLNSENCSECNYQ